MSYFTDVKTPRARKPHKCSWCGRVIDIGEKYKTWTQLGGYDAGTVKMHYECWVIHDGEDFEPYVHKRGGL